MNNKNEIMKYKNFYQIGFETCEFITEKKILRSHNNLIDTKTSYPSGIKEIEIHK